MNYIALIFISLLIIGCTNQEDAKKALSSMGFTDIETHGYSWFSCSKDDWYHTKFTAYNPKGQFVDGVVCSGLFFKNSTVRF